MSKHTEGPWIAAASPSSVVGWPIVGPQGRSIANVSWMQKPQHISDEGYALFSATCAANARLIAAAPDLLDALLNFTAGRDISYVDALEVARAAIAKATGESA